jgi:hypothetical protein
MKKLVEDFGVTALFGTIILLGSFTVLITGLLKGAFDPPDLLVLIGSWVSGILTGYLLVKAGKTGSGK